MALKFGRAFECYGLHCIYPIHIREPPWSRYRINCKYSNAFQYLEPCRVAIPYPMPDSKEGLQYPCSRQHQDIISAHTVVLDCDLKHWWTTWSFEYFAAIRYSGVDCNTDAMQQHIAYRSSSVTVLAEIPVSSPQKLFIFTIKKIICWVKVSKNKII